MSSWRRWSTPAAPRRRPAGGHAHLGLFEGDDLLAACPVYRKDHSWGEFVFDFGWAHAYAHNGLDYYPKLTCMSPFSPVNGARLLTRPGAGRSVAAQHAGHGTGEADGSTADCPPRTRCSSMRATARPFASAAGCCGVMCSSTGRNDGYRDFEDYLARFSAEKRKKIRRERRRCEEAGITFRMVPAASLPLRHAGAACTHVHARTFRLHGHEPYLNLAFFERDGAHAWRMR